MQLQPKPINAQLFKVHAAWQQMSAEHSSLGNPRLFNPLYDDAADVGIALHNPDSQTTTYWHLVDEGRDTEGDVMRWLFRPTVETVRRHPHLADWQVIVFND